MDESGSRKSVLVISSNYPRYAGDICGWFIHEISRRAVIQSFFVTSLSPHADRAKGQELMDGVEIRRFRYCIFSKSERLAYGSGLLYNIRKYPSAIMSIPFFIITEFYTACRILQEKRHGIIHTHWLVPQGLAGALLHRFTGTPHVATVHGSDLNLIKKYKILHPVCRFITRNSSIITVNSSYMKRQMLTISPNCRQKIQIIPMGIDPEQYASSSFTDLKQRHTAGHIILSVGRLIDWKGTEFLIMAMPAVLKRFPDAKLLIVGTGPERDALVRKSLELCLGDRIEFTGIVPAADLLSYYRSADVFVLPSINPRGKTEGLGVVLLEAMASGCPVIGSNVGGIPDIIKDGENGLLVPEQNPAILAEKIVALLSDTALAERFRQMGYKTVRSRFSWEQISRQFSAVYERVLDQHSREQVT